MAGKSVVNVALVYNGIYITFSENRLKFITYFLQDRILSGVIFLSENLVVLGKRFDTLFWKNLRSSFGNRKSLLL